MTRPIRRAVCNGMSASGVPQSRSLLILRHVAEHADVIYGSEFANLRTDETDPLPDFDWVHDPTDPARAGSFYAVRKGVGTIVHPRYRLGCLPVLGRRRAQSMQARYLIVARVEWADGERTKEGVGHAPPMRNWFLDGVFFTSVRARRLDFYGGDQNRLGPWVARRLGRDVRSVHVLALAMRKGTRASQVRELHDCPGSPDHVPFISVTH